MRRDNRGVDGQKEGKGKREGVKRETEGALVA